MAQIESVIEAPGSISSRIAALVQVWPEPRKAYPVVRWAILLRHQPRLSASEPEAIYQALKAGWPRFSAAYRQQVAQLLDVPPRELRFVEEEKVRLKVDGKTPMIDLPRLRTEPDFLMPFDLRTCIALCIDDLSSKLWIRFGALREGSEAGYPTTEVGRATAFYRSQARTFSEWFYEAFAEVAETALGSFKRVRTGLLEVTTVGLRVDEDISDEEASAWILDDEGNPNLENPQLRRVLAEAAGLDFDLRHLRQHEPEAYWLTIPSAVQLPNGELVSRSVLYLVRSLESVVQVVGVGLDDSRIGHLAGDSALKISRLIANRI